MKNYFLMMTIFVSWMGLYSSGDGDNQNLLVVNESFNNNELKEKIMKKIKQTGAYDSHDAEGNIKKSHICTVLTFIADVAALPFVLSNPFPDSNIFNYVRIGSAVSNIMTDFSVPLVAKSDKSNTLNIIKKDLENMHNLKNLKYDWAIRKLIKPLCPIKSIDDNSSCQETHCTKTAILQYFCLVNHWANVFINLNSPAALFYLGSGFCRLISLKFLQDEFELDKKYWLDVEKQLIKDIKEIVQRNQV